MATKIIYHQVKDGVDCPDGLAAAWVASKAHPKAEIIGCWYQCPAENLPRVEPGDNLIIVDFSFPKQILLEWEEIGAEILVIDHHKTAKEMLGDVSSFSKNIRVEINEEECGATLAWKYFFPDQQAPWFLMHIKDRDLWNFNFYATEPLHEVFGRLGRSFELFDLVLHYGEVSIACLISLGELLLASKRKLVSSICDRAQLGEVAGYPYIPHVALEAEEDRLVSDICQELYTKRYPNAPFVACLTSNGTWSLRSNKNHPNGGFDVGSLAAKFGGGGHHNASGFKA